MLNNIDTKTNCGDSQWNGKMSSLLVYSQEMKYKLTDENL